MAEHIHISTTTIAVSNDHFANGYQTGYLRFKTDFAKKPLTDTDLYSFIVQHIIDVRHPGLVNAGYIAGFFGALHENHPHLQDHHVPVVIAER